MQWFGHCLQPFLFGFVEYFTLEKNTSPSCWNPDFHLEVYQKLLDQQKVVVNISSDSFYLE